MPRQRRKRRGPATYDGPRRAKPPFPISLLFNVKLFYFTFIIIMIASMAAVGLGSGFGSGNNSTGAPVSSEAPVSPTPAANVYTDGPAATIDGTKPYVAVLDTDKGQITIKLATDAPKTVNSFAFLAGKGYYDGTEFFYVDRNLGAIAGDPTCSDNPEFSCSGLGGPGYSLKLEPTAEKHEQWAVVAPPLSEGGQDIHGSQFRILYAADSRLDGKETVFGQVVKGQEILDALPDRYCLIVNATNCTAAAAAALVIQKVTVEPA